MKKKMIKLRCGPSKLALSVGAYMDVRRRGSGTRSGGREMDVRSGGDDNIARRIDIINIALACVYVLERGAGLGCCVSWPKSCPDAGVVGPFQMDIGFCGLSSALEYIYRGV